MLIIRQLKLPIWRHRSSYYNSVSIATLGHFKPTTFTLQVVLVTVSFPSSLPSTLTDSTSGRLFSTLRRQTFASNPDAATRSTAPSLGQKSKLALRPKQASPSTRKRQIPLWIVRPGRGCSRPRVSPSRSPHPPRRRNRSGARWEERPTAPHSGCRRKWPYLSRGGPHQSTSVSHVISLFAGHLNICKSLKARKI